MYITNTLCPHIMSRHYTIFNFLFSFNFFYLFFFLNSIFIQPTHPPKIVETISQSLTELLCLAGPNVATELCLVLRDPSLSNSDDGVVEFDNATVLLKSIVA